VKGSEEGEEEERNSEGDKEGKT